MNEINYDFHQLSFVLNTMLLNNGAKPADLLELKEELNKFFKDSKCQEVLYTNNVDKMAFGIKVMPIINADDVYDYLTESEPYRVNKYIVELDSHLFTSLLNLTSEELMSIILYDVSHLVGDSTPIENARNALNTYLADNRDHLRISKSIHYKEILAYGLKDYMSKDQSLLYSSEEIDLYSDDIAKTYVFSDSLFSAYDKLVKSNIKTSQNTDINKFITFAWTLNLYKNIKTRRIGAMKTLMRAQELTGSRIEKMEMDNVIKRIKRIDDGDVIHEASENPSNFKIKFREKMRKARLNNIKTIENTLYEISMQIRNVEDEDDALYLMRQLNNSISIIDEYINSPDCDDYELNRYNTVLDKYKKLRDKLSSSVVYRNKNYGLFIQYPEIVENRM